MGIKKLVLCSLLAVSFALGAFGYDINTASAETAQQQLPLIILKPGQNQHIGVATIINNYQGAISYHAQSGMLVGVKPGQAIVSIYKNGYWYDYEVLVKDRI